MLQPLRTRLSYANVMSTLALTLALGGVSYAATALPRDSVGTNQLRHGAVTASKVRAGSLLAKDFARGQLPSGARGPIGPAGPAGSIGPAGPAGPKGDSGASTVTARTATEPNVGAGQVGSLDIACQPGEWAAGGGAYFPMGGSGERLGASFPVRIVRDKNGNPKGEGGADGKTPDGWEVTGVNGAASPRDFVGYVVCVAP